MIRLGSLLGFVFSLTVIFAAYMTIPDQSLADAQKTAGLAEGCVAEQVALDEGYGVTRTETHVVCQAQKAEAARERQD